MSDTPKEPAPFRLDRGDVLSPTWQKLRRHLQARQQYLRARNDDPNLDPAKTAFLRGELRGIKSLLALDSPDPAVVADEEPDGQ